MKHIDILKENKWLILILFVATFLRLYKIDFQSLWMDEIYSMNVSSPNQTLSNLISEVNAREGFPYLYFITLKILFTIFGHTAIIARLFSAFFGVLSVFAVYKFGKSLFTNTVGLVAAVLMAINEYNIYISQDARPYTLYLFATIVSFYFLSTIIKENTRKNAILYGLSVGFLVNINFFSFINILSQIVIISFFVALTKKNDRIVQVKNYFFSGTIALLMLLPNYKMIVKLLTIKSFWIPKPTPDSFSLMFKEFLGNSEMTLFIYTPLFFYFLFKLFNEKETKNINEIKTNKLVYAFLLFFGWIFIFITFLTVRSYGQISLMLTRYFTSIIPVFILVIAVGIYLIRNQIAKILVLLTITVYSMINIFIVKKYYSNPNKAQFREASNYVISRNNKLEKTYTSQKYWFDYYFNEQTTKIKLEEIEFESLIQQMRQDTTKIKPFWFVDAFGKTYIPSESAQRFIDNNFYIENYYDGFQAWTRHFVLLKDVPIKIDISKFKDLKPFNGDPFMLNIETYDKTNNLLKIVGWAYFDKQSSEKSEVSILLIKDGKAQKLISQKVNRPDVTSYFKCDFDASNSGFNTAVDISTYENGKYQIAIYLLNKDTKKEGLVLTDKFLEK